MSYTESFNIDQERKAYEYAHAQPEIMKYDILLKVYGFTINQWDAMTERYSNSKVVRKGRCISFEGTQQDFDSLYDRLNRDQSKCKIIGVYNGK
jgi:hypothetical protein